MKTILHKIAASLAFVLFIMLEAALIFASFVGLTTTIDDAANLPRLLNWLLGTPWWVPSILLPCTLLAYAAWVFRPDMSIEKARKEYKASNDRAWEFMPEFRAYTENMATNEAKLLELVERVEKRCLAMENELSNLRLENSTLVNSSLNKLKAANEEVLGLSLAAAQTLLRSEISEQLRMAERMRLNRIADHGISPDDPNAGTPYGL